MEINKIFWMIWSVTVVGALLSLAAIHLYPAIKLWWHSQKPQKISFRHHRKPIQ